MASSRTGSARYRRNRARVLSQARADGITHCPGYDGRVCGRELDYDQPLTPASAEADHVIEHRFGGRDDVDNLRVLCRTCNLERNSNKPVKKPVSEDAFRCIGEW